MSFSHFYYSRTEDILFFEGFLREESSLKPEMVTFKNFFRSWGINESFWIHRMADKT